MAAAALARSLRPGPSPLPVDDLKGLRSSLDQWVARARAAGLDDEGIRAVFADSVRPEPMTRVVA